MAASNDFDVSGNHGGGDFWVVKLTSDTTTSIEQISEYSIDISVFPNPFINNLNITINNYEVSEVILYDIGSRKLLQKKFSNSVVLNTEHLARGLYLYEVRNRNSSNKQGKLVKY